MQNLRYYFPGIIFMLVAILVIAVPEILVAFVASIFIMAGIGALYVGHTMRKSETGFRGAYREFSDDDFFGRRIVRRFYW